MKISDSFPFFDFIFGWLCVLSVFVFSFCITTLKRNIDVNKLKNPDEIARAYNRMIPKPESLTKAGLVKYKIAKIAFPIMVGTVAVMLISDHFRHGK
ncbi:MAG: hypothetical protein JSS11_08350 [Verrucomicrobia bacterium]|nr:hypothetical protein [Verrucomicrobiota bacterium]